MTLPVFRCTTQPRPVAPLAALWSVLLSILCALTGATHALERIKVAPDGNGFIGESTGAAFVPWGFNYGNAGRLMEDFWETEWSTLEGDFAEMKALGANVARMHLQFGKFMDAPDRANPAALAKLRDLLKLAEKTGVYLDLTGLACYRTSDVPAWYDAMDDDARWKAQAAFWKSIAETCAGSTAVFCYDLMNEPISPGGKTEKWYSGHLLGGFDFIQNIARDPRARSRMEIACAWIDQLTAAIREKDKDTPITVGMLPWVTGWKHLSGFLPKEVANHVDFLSVHIYPKTKQPDEAPRALEECVSGKPLVIEETFPLECTVEELEAFLRASRKTACGWIWHYDGMPLAEYDALENAGTITLAQSIWRAGLRSFQKLRSEFVTLPK